jgi:hypothetical protein
MNDLLHSRPARRQRGAATLLVTLLLFFVMTMVAAYANRNLVFEQQASANLYRSTRAFEAAEAGAEWAVAMLNDPRPVDEQCRPSSTGLSFRDRIVTIDATTGRLAPVTWNDAGVDKPLRTACARDGEHWNCSCTHDGAATPASRGNAAAFTVEWIAHSHAGVLQAIATGCTSLAGPCGDIGSPADASAVMHLNLGLLPGMATLPPAPLTVRGDVQAGSAAIGFQHLDPSSGAITVHAGGEVHAPNARLLTAPGAPVDFSVIEGDNALKGLSGDQFFVSFFGLDKALWRQQPAVRRLRCEDACATALAAPGLSLVWLDGDSTIDGSAIVGSPQRPVIIVCDGALTIRGQVLIHGLVYAKSLSWQDTAAGPAALHGAAMAEGSYQGNGSPDFIYSPAVLAAIKSRSGSFARVAGSWKDF